MVVAPIVVAVTQGDTKGVGAEVLIKAISKLIPQIRNVKFLILGDPGFFRKVQRRLGIRLHERAIRMKEIPSAFFSWKTPVFSLKDGTDDLKENLSTAVSLIKRKDVSALVTMPAKKITDGSRTIGHTELLAQLCGVRDFGMLFFHEKRLRILPLSLHIPLRYVSENLSIEKIVSAAQLLAAHMRSDFAIEEPRLGVCALNPHSGEGGSIGDEENIIIAPAVEQINKIGIRCIGPYNSYDLISLMLRGELDSIIALYHDQALTPFKLLFGNRGVNMTLGLGLIRTSPLHGTAYDIAGSGIADPQGALDALIAAIRLAESRRNRQSERR